MNLYRVGLYKGEVIETTDIDIVEVHGSDNYKRAYDMLKSGMSINEVRKKFCSRCGELVEKHKSDWFCVTDCGGPQPQA